MIKLFTTIFTTFLLLYSCGMKHEKSIEKWKQEILDTEKSFANMVREEGIHRAFISFAAEDAVLMRENDLVIGKNKIDSLYKNHNAKGLSWIPEYIDVASSGDLGYTYGRYSYSYTDSTGKTIETKGVFHTVWKRQADGNWRFVWD